MQQFRTAAVVELIILICLIGWEVSRPKDQVPSARFLPASGEKAPEPAALIEPQPMPARLPPPPHPKLVADNVEPPAGSIPRIMMAALEPAKGQRVELAECYQAYTQACSAESKRAVPPTQFVEPLKRLCHEIGIRTKVQGAHVYLIDVRLAALRADAGLRAADG